MKKGIALLITLGFLTILSGLIAYIFTINQKSFELASQIDSFNQDSILFVDIKKMLDSYVKDINSSGDLSNFLVGLPGLKDEKNDLFLEVKISALNGKININSLLVNKKIDKSLTGLLIDICNRYNVLDSDFLISLILDTIDLDDVERVAQSEISLVDVKFKNGKITNSRHFKQILNYYTNIVKDTNAKRVPWDEIIFFGEVKKDILDCDRLENDIVLSLGYDPNRFTGCQDLNDSKNLEKYNLSSFNKKNDYFVKVDLGYSIEEGKLNSISFNYNLKSMKCSNIVLKGR